MYPDDAAANLSIGNLCNSLKKDILAIKYWVNAVNLDKEMLEFIPENRREIIKLSILPPQDASSPIGLPRQTVNIRAAAAAAYLIYVLAKSGKDLDNKGRRQAVDAAAANNTTKLASSINAQGPPSKEKGINFVTRLLTQPQTIPSVAGKMVAAIVVFGSVMALLRGLTPIIAPVTTKTEKGGVLPCVTSDSTIWNWTTSWSSLRTLHSSLPRGRTSAVTLGCSSFTTIPAMFIQGTAGLIPGNSSLVQTATLSSLALLLRAKATMSRLTRSTAPIINIGAGAVRFTPASSPIEDLPRRIVNRVAKGMVKVGEKHLKKKISEWEREAITSPRIQQAIALSGHTTRQLKAKGVIFVVAPWRSGAISYVDSQGTIYIILSDDVSIEGIAREINFVLEASSTPKSASSPIEDLPYFITPRWTLNKMVKAAGLFHGRKHDRKINEWPREDITSPHIQQAIALLMIVLKRDLAQVKQQLETKGVIFVRAPWRKVIDYYWYNESTLYIILPDEAEAKDIAYVILEAVYFRN